MLNQTDAMLNGTSMLLRMTRPDREETQVTVAFKAKFSAEEPLGLMSYRHPNLELGLE